MANVEWLVLADSAQVVGNKLFLMGGGWDVLTINTGFPAQHRMALAVAFRVPWNETNQKHNSEIELRTEDGQTLLKIEGQFEVGRPAGIKGGQDQRMQFAADLSVPITAPGTYVVAVRLEGQELYKTYFNVIAGPGVALPQRSPNA